MKQLSVYNRSKILIIDIIGNIFNNHSKFYKTINQHKGNRLTNNLLVLTTLTAGLKKFLNATFTTEFNNIYGKMSDEPMAVFALKPTSTTVNDSNDNNNVNESAVINLLEKRLNEYGRRDAYKSAVADNILVHFNESELNLIASVFEKLYNNSCRLATTTKTTTSTAIHAESVSNVAVSSHDMYNETNKFKKLGNATRADGVSESLPTCASNNNSLSKCEIILRERAILFANSTRTRDITKVLCEQIQLWRQQNPLLLSPPPLPHQRQNNKSNSVPNILNRNVNNLGKNLANTTITATTKEERPNDGLHGNLISATSSEFVNLIPNQLDAEFSEYFPFFDFIVTKLVLSHNLTVNYNNQSGSSFVTAAPNGSKSASESVTATGNTYHFDNTFDFCILELHLNEASSIGNVNGNNNNSSSSSNNNTDAPLNRTHITTTFVWRPVLILRQNELHQNIFVTHPLLPYRYPSWFFDNTHKFWTCGLLCWILAGIVILLLVCILVATITFGLAIR